MKIIIGCDHRGVQLKNEIVKNLKKEGLEVVESTVKNYENDDYPDFAFDVAKKIENDTLGVLICGNGIGISIAANKVKGIRCARVVNTDDVFKAKTHNGANIIAFGADNSIKNAMDMINVFINTKTSTEERHIKRVEKIIKYENGEYNEL
jgi:ribose 5-phosphate isomerase B